MVINISSDAGAEHYEGWGGYGSSKAALDHQTLTWAAEEPEYTWYAFDPGDLRTAMHQAAFPGEDISDRPGAGDRCARLIAPDRVRAAQRALPGSRSGDNRPFRPVRRDGHRRLTIGALGSTPVTRFASPTT